MSLMTLMVTRRLVIMRCKMRDVATPSYHRKVVQINAFVPNMYNKVIFQPRKSANGAVCPFFFTGGLCITPE
jgi:hypothetical protein